MEVHSGILNITFAFALFGLLVYKIRALVRSHLIPYLIQQKQALRRRYAEIIEKKKLVASTTTRIDSQIKNQQTSFVFLEKKVQAWHAFLRKEHAEREHADHALFAHLEEKRRIQHECLTATKLAKEAMQGAFEQADQELTRAYAGNEGKVLLERFIDKLSVK